MSKVASSWAWHFEWVPLCRAPAAQGLFSVRLISFPSLLSDAQIPNLYLLEYSEAEKRKHPSISGIRQPPTSDIWN